MAGHLLLWTLLLSVSTTTVAQTPGVSAFLGRPPLMPTIESRRVMPSLAEVPAETKGTLLIDTIIGRNGKVQHTKVVASPDPTGAFDSAGLAAIRSWQFRPAISSGADPVAVLVRIAFEIQPPPKPDQPRVTVHIHAVPDETPADDPAIWQAATPVNRSMTHPRLIRQITPSYTNPAMRAKIVGLVELDVAIAADGSVSSARVKKSLDKEHGLDRQALVTAGYWLFEPARVNGEPVACRVTLQLEFRLH